MIARAQDQADIIRAEAEEAKTRATSEALEIITNARRTADKAISDAKKSARETLQAARDSAGAVRAEGAELVDNLKEMGSSLRSDSEARLLRDVRDGAGVTRSGARMAGAATTAVERLYGRSNRPLRPGEAPLDAELEDQSVNSSRLPGRAHGVGAGALP